MDNDQQIPLKFLDEAEYCCDQIESTVLGLASKIPDPQELDQALRAAHSVKGGAAMMGFTALSHVAHQLEDFFKILRVRYHSKSVSTAVETLLLAGIDCLRQVSDLHRQGQSIDESWLTAQTQPIFDQLHQQLGELRPEDENALLAQEGDVDPAILLFEMGAKEAIDLLEAQFGQLSPAQLAESLRVTSAELSDFGRMAQLDRFVDLCQSISRQSLQVTMAEVENLAHQAVKLWRKSHSLVLLGRLDKIPTQLSGWVKDVAFSGGNFVDPLNLDEQYNPDLSGLEELTDFQSLDLNQLQLEFANVAIAPTGELVSFGDEILDAAQGLSDLVLVEMPDLPLGWGNDALEDGKAERYANEQQPDIADFLAQGEASLALLGELATLDLPSEPLDLLAVAPTPTAVSVVNSSNRQTVRIPVEYLQQSNRVFGQLILERNAINLRLAEIRSYTELLRKRMRSLELTNKELRQWYDRASTEGLIPSAVGTSPLTTSDSAGANRSVSALAGFDALEMDQYSDLHLVSQDQIETIVQLQEVATDIEFSLQDMTQSVRSLNQTTRVLQKNLMRTQMLPFADVVKRFPRLIRDLSVQFGKSVNLQILGENTGIDRAILDNLSDPLVHLLRNAFDHGIEDSATRLAVGKPAEGNIVLQASHRSGETIITITDDGGGIQLDRIRDRLQQMGLPPTEIDRFSEAELLDTIFEPGFSTATSLTELSGRGVGMDVVRTNIEEIRGRITVKTAPGQGTTFTIHVPFALSILRVMLLERAGLVFAVSVDQVQEMLRFQPDLLTADGTKMTWQSQEIPLLALEQGVSLGRGYRSVELSGNPTIAHPTVLVVGNEQKTSTAFYIDRFWGEKEVTMRPIDSPMLLTPGFGNAIILGDGRVVPLIDLLQLATWISVYSQANAADHWGSVPEDSHSAANTILVIDDSINVRRYLAAMLEKEGYQVEQAKDGQEAVDKLLGGLTVQAAICDVEMPRLDGYGVLEALRSIDEFEALPIIMLTSRNSAKHRDLAMNLGASAYFSKPYTEPELLSTLSALIAK